jgi:hypothetical protein
MYLLLLQFFMLAGDWNLCNQKRVERGKAYGDYQFDQNKGV